MMRKCHFCERYWERGMLEPFAIDRSYEEFDTMVWICPDCLDEYNFALSQSEQP